MKKVIRLNENDIERLVKKILRENDSEWFHDVAQPSTMDSFLFDLFSKLKIEEVKFNDYNLTFYTDQNNDVVMIKSDRTTGSYNILYLDYISIVEPLDDMGDRSKEADDEVELSVKRMFKEIFGEDVGVIDYSIPGSYLQVYDEKVLRL